jgi:hypothetical protein
MTWRFDDDDPFVFPAPRKEASAGAAKDVALDSTGSTGSNVVWLVPRLRAFKKAVRPRPGAENPHPDRDPAK